jgi:hypothetical protein
VGGVRGPTFDAHAERINTRSLSEMTTNSDRAQSGQHAVETFTRLAGSISKPVELPVAARAALDAYTADAGMNDESNPAASLPDDAGDLLSNLLHFASVGHDAQTFHKDSYTVFAGVRPLRSAPAEQQLYATLLRLVRDSGGDDDNIHSRALRNYEAEAYEESLTVA